MFVWVNMLVPCCLCALVLRLCMDIFQIYAILLILFANLYKNALLQSCVRAARDGVFVSIVL